jgi:hypothetical protein
MPALVTLTAEADGAFGTIRSSSVFRSKRRLES